VKYTDITTPASLWNYSSKCFLISSYTDP
jgi:hypothetical protein